MASNTPYATVERISPAQAAKYLESNLKNNRNISPGIVNKYAEDMRGGEWTVTHQGIAFDESGQLIDGQHRLAAIVKAGVGVEMLVTRGIPYESIRDIDQGRKRSEAAQLKVAYGSDFGKNEISVLRLLHGGGGGNQLSVAKIGALLEKHRENVFTASGGGNSVGGKNLRNAAIYAAASGFVIAGGKRQIAERFIEVVRSGFAEGRAESAAVCLRNYLLNHKGSGGAGGSVRNEFFITSGLCLERFARGQAISRAPKCRNSDGSLKPFPFNYSL